MTVETQSSVSPEELPLEELGDYSGRMGQLGPYTVNFESMPADFGGPDFFRGLPDDACQCEHWGYVIKGRLAVTYTDGSEEIINAGEAYYLRPGHVGKALEETQTVEFSPTAEWQRTMEQIGKNIEEMARP
jgi:hypothetical protein